MKAKAWIITVGFAAVILGASIVPQLVAPKPDPDAVAKWTKLSDQLPKKLGSMNGRDEPIATSEEMKRAVDELLNYDDGIYRIYEANGRRLSVYVARWSAGKMSPRLVASHTPDVCWVGNGWTRDTVAENQSVSIQSALADLGLREGEARVFRANQKPEYVVFWHLVGNDVVSYQTGFAPPWWAFLDEMRKQGLNLRKEQVFVRISSDEPLDTQLTKSDAEPLRDVLVHLGLAKPSGGQGS